MEETPIISFWTFVHFSLSGSLPCQHPSTYIFLSKDARWMGSWRRLRLNTSPLLSLQIRSWQKTSSKWSFLIGKFGNVSEMSRGIDSHQLWVGHR
jgi:hypothetical protein